MPEIEIRAANLEDLESLSAFEHSYYTEHVWQMNLEKEAEITQANFRRIRLPRRIFVPYPRDRKTIFSQKDESEAFLIASLNDRSVGYIQVHAEKNVGIARVSDLVISASMRRQGIASVLILAVLDLVSHRRFHTLILEMQSKNDPAIAMASKLGFNFCGFRDHYYPNRELALFFSRFVR